jgi:hypothetical protein
MDQTHVIEFEIFLRRKTYRNGAHDHPIQPSGFKLFSPASLRFLSQGELGDLISIRLWLTDPRLSESAFASGQPSEPWLTV